MSPRELTRFALQGLRRQKVRTALTLVGVAAGTCALTFSLSLGLGLWAVIDTEFKGRADFWRIAVQPDEPPPDPADVPAGKAAVRPDVPAGRRERLAEALVDRYAAARRRKPPIPLTADRIAAIAALPGVAEVRTYRAGDGQVVAGGKTAKAAAVGGPLADLTPRLIAGRLPASPDAREIVVTELVLYDLGVGDIDPGQALGLEVKLVVGGLRNAQSAAMARALTGRLPEEITPAQAEALGTLADQLRSRLDTLPLPAAQKEELRKLLAAPADRDPDEDGPLTSGATANDAYRVCGVVRLLTREERKKAGLGESWELANGAAFLPPETAEGLFLRLPWTKDAGFRGADVRVRPGADLPGTAAAIEAMGYKTFSLAKWFEGAKREVALIAAGLNLFALIALFVAAIGITNTLVTSVVERTGEIGVLRAVGATRGQILGLFLTEGAFIGFVGGLLGLGLARGFMAAADGWVRRQVAQLADNEKLLGQTLFIIPWWLGVGAVAFALVVTTAAAYYPARRAARIHPIEALRYG